MAVSEFVTCYSKPSNFPTLSRAKLDFVLVFKNVYVMEADFVDECFMTAGLEKQLLQVRQEADRYKQMAQRTNMLNMFGMNASKDKVCTLPILNNCLKFVSL